MLKEKAEAEAEAKENARLEIERVKAEMERQVRANAEQARQQVWFGSVASTIYIQPLTFTFFETLFECI